MVGRRGWWMLRVTGIGWGRWGSMTGILMYSPFHIWVLIIDERCWFWNRTAQRTTLGAHTDNRKLRICYSPDRWRRNLQREDWYPSVFIREWFSPIWGVIWTLKDFRGWVCHYRWCFPMLTRGLRADDAYRPGRSWTGQQKLLGPIQGTDAQPGCFDACFCFVQWFYYSD